jgi:hypothetical protein
MPPLLPSKITSRALTLREFFIGGIAILSLSLLSSFLLDRWMAKKYREEQKKVLISLVLATDSIFSAVDYLGKGARPEVTPQEQESFRQELEQARAFLRKDEVRRLRMEFWDQESSKVTR